jgi:hypothetical protein
VIGAVIFCIDGVTSKLTTLAVVITLTIDNVHFCPDSSGDESTKLECFDGGCGTFDSDSNNDTILQRQTPTRRGLSCGSDMVRSIQRG